MIEIFNEFMSCISYIVDALFNRMEFIPDLGFGWVVLALLILDIITNFIFGRMK